MYPKIMNIQNAMLLLWSGIHFFHFLLFVCPWFAWDFLVSRLCWETGDTNLALEHMLMLNRCFNAVSDNKLYVCIAIQRK